MPRPGDYFCVPAAGRFRHVVKVGQWLMGDGWTSIGHCGIYVGHGRVIEAVRGVGIEYDYVDNFLDEPVWSSFELEDWQRDTVVEVAHARAGQSYWEGNAAGMLLRHFGLPGGRSLHDWARPVCSQFVAGCYAAATVDLAGPRQSPMDVTPARLYRLALKSQREKALTA